MSPPPELVVSRTIRAAPDRVFDAWTTADQITRWWGGGGVTCPEAQVELAVGGAYRIANAMPDGTVTWISGVFEFVERPYRLRYTWDVEPADPDAASSVVAVEFAPVDGGTLVTVNQTRIPSDDARLMFEAGWNGCLDGLRSMFNVS